MKGGVSKYLTFYTHLHSFTALYFINLNPLNDKENDILPDISHNFHGNSVFFLYRSICQAKEICARMGTGTA